MADSELNRLRALCEAMAVADPVPLVALPIRAHFAYPFDYSARGLNFRRSANPAGVTQTSERPFPFWTQTSPWSFASSHTGSLGQDVRQASIVSSYDRSL